jgi:histidine triad (HIT) family protein
VTACTFCRIIAGSQPAEVVFSDDRHVAILDHRPLFPGHVLVLPRSHVETMMELDEPEVGPLFAVARRLAVAVEEALAAEGIFVAVNNRVSQSVPHLHVHVVPRRKKDGLRGFFWPRTPYRDDEEMARVAGQIRAVILAPHPP